MALAPIPVPAPVVAVRRHTDTVVISEGAITGIFGAWTIFVIGGHLIGFLPLWFFELMARFWGAFAVVYVIATVLPIFIAVALGEREFKIERWWSLAFFGANVILFVIVLAFGVFSLWYAAIFVTNFLCSVADLMIISTAWKIRAEYRRLAAGGP